MGLKMQAAQYVGLFGLVGVRLVVADRQDRAQHAVREELAVFGRGRGGGLQLLQRADAAPACRR